MYDDGVPFDRVRMLKVLRCQSNLIYILLGITLRVVPILLEVYLNSEYYSYLALRISQFPV